MGWLLLLVVACCLLGPTASAESPDPTLDEARATAFARLALAGIGKEYPNKPADVLNDDGDVRPPREIHPAFYGCYDWHSAVHGHWMLVRILRRLPGLPIEGEVRAALAANLTPANLAAEARFFARPGAKSYERPYGWAWLLKLAEELHDWDDPQGREWSKNLQPLVDSIVASYLDYFPKQTYPNRSGVHSSTAFGFAFALDYARAVGHEKLEALLIERSRAYFGRDRAIPAAWEPDGADFFSPSLMEADLMRRVLPAEDFQEWFRQFLPNVAANSPPSIMEPANVTDRTDPQLVHLDGLNISRAWCMRSIAAAFAESDPEAVALEAAAKRHAAAGLPHVCSGDYAGEHWLASFATYLLTSTPTDPLGAERSDADTAPVKPDQPASRSRRTIEGFSILVDDALLPGGSEETLGREALAFLAAKLAEIRIVLPPEKVDALRKVTIVLDKACGALSSMQYHPSADWLADNGYPRSLEKCVHLPRARDVATRRNINEQPWVMLHELAHAYHDQVLGFDDPRILAAWEDFKLSGKGDDALLFDGSRVKHYGLTDQKEFFAEMTEAYFGSNDFHPFNRAQLKTEFPKLYELLAEIWGPLR